MKRHFPLLLLVLAVGLAACSKQPAPPITATEGQAESTTYQVAGILRAVNLQEASVVIEHEEIPGYMAAMTMPFEFQTAAEIEGLEIGDAIQFELVVTEETSWIQHVRRLASRTVKTKPAAPAPEARTPRLKEGDGLPAFTLLDDQRREITPATFEGKPLLVTFMFTRCPIPNYCPRMSQNFKAIDEALAGQPEIKKDVRYLTISFDPEFDKPEMLARYADAYRTDAETWRFATGSAEQIQMLTDAFSVFLRNEGGTIGHGLCTALIGPDGTIRNIWRGNAWEPSEVVTALESLHSGSLVTISR